MVDFIFYGFSSLLVGAALAVIFSRNPVHSVLFLIFAFFNAAGLFVLMGAEFLAMLLIIVYVGAVAVLFLFVVMMLNVTPAEQRSIFTRGSFQKSFKTVGHVTLYAFVFGLTFVALSAIAPLTAILQKGATLKLETITHSPWSLLSPSAPLYIKVVIASISALVARALAQRVTRTSFLTLVGGAADSLSVLILLGSVFVGLFVFVALGWVTSPLSEDLIFAPIPPVDLTTNTHALGQLIYTNYIFAFQAAGVILLIAMIGAIVLTLRKREGVKKQDAWVQTSRRPEDTLVLKKVPLRQGIE
jgi:NADH-quinone oxidoreductase subunit J